MLEVAFDGIYDGIYLQIIYRWQHMSNLHMLATVECSKDYKKDENSNFSRYLSKDHLNLK